MVDRALKLYFESRLVFISMLLALIGYIAAVLWPAWYWVDVRSIFVPVARESQPVTMVVDRSIERDFVADWHVVVRRHDGRGWEVYCTANGGSNYKTDASLPVNLTLDWWADGQCSTLPQGVYTLTTVWYILPDWFPKKTLVKESNIFEVRPCIGRCNEKTN